MVLNRRFNPSFNQWDAGYLVQEWGPLKKDMQPIKSITSGLSEQDVNEMIQSHTHLNTCNFWYSYRSTLLKYWLE